MKTTEEHTDYTLTYETGPEAAQAAFNVLLKWFKKEEHFSGESIQQSDSTYEDAPELLTQLAEEVFKFGQKWNE